MICVTEFLAQEKEVSEKHEKKDLLERYKNTIEILKFVCERNIWR